MPQITTQGPDAGNDFAAEPVTGGTRSLAGVLQHLAGRRIKGLPGRLEVLIKRGQLLLFGLAQAQLAAGLECGFFFGGSDHLIADFLEARRPGPALVD